MKELKNVQGSKEQAKPLIVGKTTVYVHTNIQQLKDEDGNLTDMYSYDEVQYTKDEYIQVLADKNNVLEQDVINTQLALCELYESLGDING